MDAFDVAMNAMMAWNQIGLLAGGLVMFGLGALLFGDAMRWRITGRLVKARIVDVRALGQPKVKKPGAVREQKNQEATAGVGWGPFMRAARKSPGAATGGVVIALVVLGIPSMLVCAGLYFGYDYMSLRTAGVEVPGEIVEIKNEHDSEGGTTYRPVIAYETYNGMPMREEGSLSTGWRVFRRGEQVAVFYDKDDPARFVVKAFWYNMALPIGLTLMGSMLLLIFSGKFPKISRKGRPKKKNVSYAGEMYYPVFEYKLPNGELGRYEGDTGSNSFLSQLPGTECAVLVHPDDPEKIRKPTFAIPFIGLALAMPGAVMLYIAAASYEFTLISILMFLGITGFGAYKIGRLVKPRAEWETKAAFRARMAEKSRLKRQQGRILTPDEISDRIVYYVSLQKMWLPVMVLIGAGLIAGGYYWGVNHSAFKARALATKGTVVEVVSDYNSTSDGSSYTYHPVVEFETAAGKRTEFTDRSGSSPPAYSGGEQVAVLYDPDNPRKAQIDRGWLDRLPMLGLMAVGILVLLQSMWTYFRLRQHAGQRFPVA
ncbi:MAG: DUF3592 domain-containing protein [Pseudomonadota bacterium]|nr:MAG: DUF3592 domain-containing protein [Pseudomonadota bacterium]